VGKELASFLDMEEVIEYLLTSLIIEPIYGL
jgi:hypothetical protein